MVIHKWAARAGLGTGQMPGVKIGIHVAQALVGRSASRFEIDADAKRALWPVLEQLVQAIGPDQTAASAAAVPFLERRFELVPVDGLAANVDSAYRLTGQEYRGFGLWGVMTRFVGRQDELAVLRGCAAAAERGHGQLASVVEPGVGKSRLFGSSPLRPCRRLAVLEPGAFPGKTTPISGDRAVRCSGCDAMTSVCPREACRQASRPVLVQTSCPRSRC
jgi:hypothetical protein